MGNIGKLVAGDSVTICCPTESEYDDRWCDDCDEAVGFDEYDMGYYNGQTIEIEQVYEPDEVAWSMPRCGAQVFRYDGWLWTTCWISHHFPMSRSPSWEV